MKKICVILTIFLICTIGKTATDSNNTTVPDFNNTAVPDTNTTADCQEKIRQLERTIESLQKRLDKIVIAYNELKKENEQLKTLSPKEKTATNIKSTANFDPNNGIVYHGKKRDLRWFYYMYNRFRDKIACAGGKYYDIQERLPNQKTISKDSFVMGTVVTTPPHCKVYRVLGNGEMLIIRPGSEGSESSTTVYQPALSYGQRSASSETYTNSIPSITELVFHVKGITDNRTEDKPFSMSNLIAAGSYTYENRKIQSFIVYKPLTKEQFAEAINSGFELTDVK
jgi:TolA-binding protein